MTSRPIKILGIPGSLRQQSYNRGLINAAQEVAPQGVEVTMYLLHDLPLYNADVEAEGDPAEVTRFKNAIAEADAILIATPQYNASVPGVLKNAIDWASRRPRTGGDSVLADKPVAIVGVTPGKSFTEPAQIDLRKILKFTKSRVMPEPQVKLGAAPDRYSENPELPDEETRQQIRAALDALVEFITVAEAKAAAAD
ncbi:MAG: NAD(P)H-dependent oxidoreductase [Chloroflexia bacterium]|nr:NAD(P)H-dependent oxidoreductase [Chloroflexia bacterium]